MIAYEFYYHDAKGDSLIGILPERRKDPKRITKESVMNWVKNVLSNNQDIKNIYFVQVEI